MERTSGLRFGIILVIITILFMLVSPVVVAMPVTTEEPYEIIEPTKTEEKEKIEKTIEELVFEQIQDIVYIKPKDSTEALLRCNELIRYKNNLCKVLPAEGDDTYALVYEILKPEFLYIDELNAKYKNDLEIMTKWENHMKEYPVATEIWLYMRNEFGWSEETCAGILGNMMAEIGGGTLNLNNWASDSSSGYGLIQWVGNRYSGIKTRYGNKPTVEQQLNYMRDELYGTNGVTQQVNTKELNIILNKSGSETPERIAYIFACYYERCAGYARAPRKGFARIAYDYFVN